MKILICGKGGSGKSTIASLLAKSLIFKGYRVLVVDADESNYGLSTLLGLSDPRELMDYVGGKKAVKGKMTPGRSQAQKPPVFTEQWSIDQIPSECVSKQDGLYLLQVGKVKHFQEGCACPMGVLCKDFLSGLKLEPKDMVIVDAEAGVEHLSRGIASGVDLILAVLDPSYESIRLSEKICDMVKEADKPVYFILNKTSGEIEKKMVSQLGEKQVIGAVQFSEPIQDAGLSGKSLNQSLTGFEKITSFVINKELKG